MKGHFVFLIFVVCFLNSCITIEKYWSGDDFIVEKEVYWSTGSGSRRLKRLSSHRTNTITWTYNAKGQLLSYRKDKMKRYGCVGRTFYSFEKKYDVNGKVVSTTLWTDSTRTKTGKFIKKGD